MCSRRKLETWIQRKYQMCSMLKKKGTQATAILHEKRRGVYEVSDNLCRSALEV